MWLHAKELEALESLDTRVTVTSFFMALGHGLFSCFLQEVTQYKDLGGGGRLNSLGGDQNFHGGAYDVIKAHITPAWSEQES